MKKRDSNVHFPTDDLVDENNGIRIKSERLKASGSVSIYKGIGPQRSLTTFA